MKTPAVEQEGRSAFAFEPPGCPAVINVTSYRFGSDPESTREDRVRRIPAAALLVHLKGRVLDCDESGVCTPLPQVALLGPSTRAHFWATRPNTRFFMVNLAPGATRVLFDIEPDDILNRIETLNGHGLARVLAQGAKQGSKALHGELCRRVMATSPEELADDRLRKVIQALRDRTLGERVRDYADHFGMTCRTLQRLVRSKVGLTPKHIIAIERMRTLIQLTAGGWSATAADLAQAGGFFDQSHLRYEMLRHRMGTVGELVGGDHIVVRR